MCGDQENIGEFTLQLSHGECKKNDKKSCAVFSSMLSSECRHKEFQRISSSTEFGNKEIEGILILLGKVIFLGILICCDRFKSPVNVFDNFFFFHHRKNYVHVKYHKVLNFCNHDHLKQPGLDVTCLPLASTSAYLITSNYGNLSIYRGINIYFRILHSSIITYNKLCSSAQQWLQGMGEETNGKWIIPDLLCTDFSSCFICFYPKAKQPLEAKANPKAVLMETICMPKQLLV